MAKYRVSLLVDFPDDMHMEDIIENLRGSATGKVLSVVPNIGFRIGSSGETKDLSLEQYQCMHCGRFFYINKSDKSSFDLGFGCPYGCDDSGRLTRLITAEIISVRVCEEARTGEDEEAN
jgi:hypothetical protein